MRKLQYLLDRKSLETIYLCYIRPIMEYGDAIWDNCTINDKSDLDKVQHEAARIVSGCTKLVSIHTLEIELGWESLEERRSKHKLTLFYKMTNGLVPSYLADLSPPSVGNSTNYSLRNANNSRLPIARTALYQQSFLPSVIRAWNNLSLAHRNSPTLQAFKSSFKRTLSKPPIYYYYGKRKLQILHTRLRTKCSALKDDLFRKNVIESPLCHICQTAETTSHYLFDCTRFSQQRAVLERSLVGLDISLHVLLFGNDSLTSDRNATIFEAVQHYIYATKRFD